MICECGGSETFFGKKVSLPRTPHPSNNLCIAPAAAQPGRPG